jgi:hypothetical protein
LFRLTCRCCDCALPRPGASKPTLVVEWLRSWKEPNYFSFADKPGIISPPPQVPFQSKRSGFDMFPPESPFVEGLVYGECNSAQGSFCSCLP